MTNQVTITTKIIKRKDITSGYQYDKLKLNDFINLNWAFDHTYYGVPLDYTLFTMKKGIKVIGGAIVLHLNKVMNYYDNKEVAIKDLHYMILQSGVIEQYRTPFGQGYATQLLKKVLEVIKEPIGALTEFASEAQFFWLNGGNLLGKKEDLWEGSGYFIFNVDPKTGIKLSEQLIPKEIRGIYDNAEELWSFNRQPHLKVEEYNTESDAESDAEFDILKTF